MAPTAPASANDSYSYNDSSSDSSSVSVEAPPVSRFSIFSDAEWSLSAARSGAISKLKEERGTIGTFTALGSAYIFRELYKQDVGHPQRFRRALLPAVLYAPVFAGWTSVVFLTYHGARTVVKDNYDIAASFVVASAIGAATERSKGRLGMLRGAGMASMLYAVGCTIGYAWAISSGAGEEVTEDSSSADTIAADTASS